MKKLIKPVLILLAVALPATLIGPAILLKAVTQPVPETGFAYSDAFLTDYVSVRTHLQQLLGAYNAEIYSHAIDEADDLYIDTYYLPATEQKNLVILTTGVHGMEGYIGSAMLDVFFGEVYPDLNREDTGIVVVANVNPYGMKHYRRYNENNVDLNRNFILD